MAVALLTLALCWAVIKLINLMASVRWAIKCAPRYVREYRQDPPDSKARLYRLLEENGGRFYPLGAKSLWFREHLFETGGTVRRKHLKVIANAFARMALDTWLYLGLVGLSLAILDAFWDSPSALERGCLAALAIWLLVYALLLLVEAIVWFLLVRSYAGVFAFMNVAKPESADSAQSNGAQEFLVFCALLVASVLAGAAAVANIERRYAAYAHMQPKGGIAAETSRLFDAGYYVIANAATIGDSLITPTVALARTVTALVILSSLLLLTCGVSLFLAIASDSGANTGIHGGES